MTNEVLISHAIAAFVIGVIQILIAIVLVTCSVVLHIKVDIGIALTPYWAGVPIVITGSIGVLLFCRKYLCLMIAFLVCNIMTLVVQAISFIINAIAVALYSSYAELGCLYKYDIFGTAQCVCKSSSGQTWIFKSRTENCNLIKDISTLIHVNAVFLALASCVNLAGSILGSIAIFSRNRSPRGAVIMKKEPDANLEI